MRKNNIPHLTAVFTFASYLASPAAYGLGIGDMKLQSALNQNLQAEIALLLSKDEQANDFKVGLAPNEKLDEAGIPWTLFLSKIKFQTVTQNGKTVIKLSSSETLKEPFLDFLLEVKSAKGSSYREFTVLVDPPSAYRSENKTALIDDQNITGNDNTYGPTRASDTLSQIASQFNKQNDVSLNRMITAIYVANPNAFSSNGINSLLADKILKIPSIESSPEFFAVDLQQTVAKPKPKTVKPKSTNVLKTSVPVPVDFDTLRQQMTDLEKKLAEIKQVIAEKETQITVPKVSEVAIPTPEKPPVVAPVASPEPVAPPSVVIQTNQVVVPKPTIPTPIDASGLISTPTLQIPTEPIAVLPPPALTAVKTPTAVVPTVAASTSLPTTESDTDMYYYITGGFGSLLIGLLGWLGFRKRNEAKNVEPEIVVVSEVSTEDSAYEQTSDEYQAVIDSSETMFSDSADIMTNEELEDIFSTANFSDFEVNDADKHDVDDVIYKADIYCAYGDNERAEQLLIDEFENKPQALEYALHLLEIYAKQDKKIEFKDFIFKLAKLGKNDLPEFWTQVSDLASEFYPEALFFMPPPAVPDPLTAIPFDEMFANVNLNEKFDNATDFDLMSFDDEEVTSGQSSTEESVPVSQEFNLNSQSLDFSDFEFNEKETPTEKFELGHFELDEDETVSAESMTDFVTSSPDKVSHEFDLDRQLLEVSGFEFNEHETPSEKFELGHFELNKDEKLSAESMTDFVISSPDKASRIFDLDSEPLDFSGFEFNEHETTTEKFDFGSFELNEEKEEKAASTLSMTDFVTPSLDKVSLLFELDSESLAEKKIANSKQH